MLAGMTGETQGDTSDGATPGADVDATQTAASSAQHDAPPPGEGADVEEVSTDADTDIDAQMEAAYQQATSSDRSPQPDTEDQPDGDDGASAASADDDDGAGQDEDEDEESDQEQERRPEDGDELTPEDRSAPERTRRRIEQLLADRRELRSQLDGAGGGVPPAIAEAQKAAQLTDEQRDAAFGVIAAARRGDARAAPILADLVNVIRETNGEAPMMALTPAEGDLPEAIADAREFLGLWPDEQRARMHAALDAYMDGQGTTQTPAPAAKPQPSDPPPDPSEPSRAPDAAAIEQVDQRLDTRFASDGIAAEQLPDHRQAVMDKMAELYGEEDMGRFVDDPAAVERAAIVAHRAVLVDRKEQELTRRTTEQRAKRTRQPASHTRTTQVDRRAPQTEDERMARSYDAARQHV